MNISDITNCICIKDGIMNNNIYNPMVMKMKYDLLRICEDGVCKNYIKMNGIEKPLDEILEQSIQCNHKKAILEFLKFMKMDNPLMEIMVDEFLEEVYEDY